MVHVDTPYLTIRWNKELKCVVMRWKAFVSGEDFRAGLDSGLELVRHKHSTKWLADLRCLGIVSSEDQEWSNQDWLPRALAAGVKYMAVVMPYNVGSRWSVDKSMQDAEDTPLVVRYFDNIERARRWLRSH